MIRLLLTLMLLPAVSFGQGVWDNTATTAVLDFDTNEFVITFDGLSLTSNIKNADCVVAIVVRRSEGSMYVSGATDPGIYYMGYTAVEGIDFGFRAEGITDVAPYTTTMTCSDPDTFEDGFDVRYRFTLDGEKSPWYIIQSVLIPTEADVTPPAVPANVVALPFDSQIVVTWDDNIDADWDHYDVYRSVGGNPYMHVGVSILISSYGDTGLSNGTEYCYKITATDDSDNESAQTVPECATPVK